MKRKVWLRGLFFLVLCVCASAFWAVGVKADVAPRYEYVYHAMDQAEWDREMDRLRHGEKFGVRSWMPEKSLFAGMNRWEILACFLVPAVLIICFCCLAAKKKIKKMGCGVILLVLVCSAAVGGAILSSVVRALNALNGGLVTRRNVKKVDILVAPRLKESYDQYQTRVRWINTDCCQECGTGLEHFYFEGHRTVCPKCNPDGTYEELRKQTDEILRKFHQAGQN